MATLNDMFPGHTGRLKLIRIMLRLQMPQLHKVPRDQPLPRHIELLLLDTLAQLNRTH